MRLPYYNLGRPTHPDYIKVFPDRPSVLLPRIKIVLRYQSKKCKIFALVDSGADYCLFPKDVADLLGINVKEGPRLLITGIGGGQIPFYFHEIDILLDKFSIKTHAGFATTGIGTSGLLGQRGFFENFVVTFDYKNSCIELKKPSLMHDLAVKFIH